MHLCSHLNFSYSNFGGFSRRFFIRTLFLSESKTPPGVPVRAMVIEKRVQNLVRPTACSSYNHKPEEGRRREFGPWFGHFKLRMRTYAIFLANEKQLAVFK